MNVKYKTHRNFFTGNIAHFYVMHKSIKTSHNHAKKVLLLHSWDANAFYKIITLEFHILNQPT